MNAITKSKPAAGDIEARLAELIAKEEELAKREAVLADREKALPPARFTIRSIHKLILSDPSLTDAQLTELAKAAGAEFKPITVKTQRALALAFIKMTKEAGHWAEKAPAKQETAV